MHAAFTGGAVAQPCVDSHSATGLVNGIIFEPPPSTSLNLSVKNLSQVISSTTSTAAQNLVEIPPWGASGQLGEI